MQSGATAVLGAAHNGHMATVELLVRLGADIKRTDQVRGRPLGACACGAMWSTLLTQDGITAVMFAAQNGHAAMVERLHQLGVDVKAEMKVRRSGSADLTPCR